MIAMYKYSCIIFLFVSFNAFSQYKITLVVKQPSVLHSADHLFVAGNFNNWNPADTNFELINNHDGASSIIFSLVQGNYEYKFTRGNWEKVETDSSGKGIKNRTLQVTSDTTIHIKIL